MKISANWLKKYIDIDCDPSELAAKLTMVGLEVEEIIKSGTVPEGVVTAKILSRKKHENSDHLSVCTVDKGDETLQIVCGAPNCDEGCIVPLATIGTTFTDGDGSFTIKKGKMRGVDSFGMMCSARELGLGSDHNGLMLLPTDTPLGIPLNSLLKTDIVYDCSVTPNRPDWLSHVGVARDLAALFGKNCKYPDSSAAPMDDSVSYIDGLVTIEDLDLCPLYGARIIKNVKICESPDWLKESLEAIGVRPINNIVDITNYVMMEMGVPLHAFDIRTLAGEKIVVRRAKNGESIIALDGKKYDLSSNDVCICDSEKPVAIAGVMGGEHSGIQNDTATVVLESAFFDPDSIRATSRRLGLASDASYRYERGVDREAVLSAGHRALQLILELAGGEYVGFCKNESSVPSPRIIEADYDRIRHLLGMDVSDERIDNILKSLGFVAEENRYTVPSWRIYDVVGVADLAEEVARIEGLDKLPIKPVRAITADFKMDACRIVEILRGQLTGIGLDEIVCGSMIDEKDAIADGIFNSDELIKPNNPISLELAVMRPSLLPGLLNVVRYNIARKNTDFALFEIGHVFCRNTERFSEERDELAIALTGRVHPERFSTERNCEYDFFDLKGVLEALLDCRRVKSYFFRAIDDVRFVKGHCAELVICGKAAGIFGEVVPALTKGMRINSPLFIAIIQLDSLFTSAEKSIYYEPISSFPPIVRDVAFAAPVELENKKVIDFVMKAHLPNLERVELFDIFEDPSLGSGRKSMAYSFVFRAPDRTLTDKEVNSAYEQLRQKLEKGLGVTLR